MDVVRSRESNGHSSQQNNPPKKRPGNKHFGWKRTCRKWIKLSTKPPLVFKQKRRILIRGAKKWSEGGPDEKLFTHQTRQYGGGTRTKKKKKRIGILKNIYNKKGKTCVCVRQREKERKERLVCLSKRESPENRVDVYSLKQTAQRKYQEQDGRSRCFIFGVVAAGESLLLQVKKLHQISRTLLKSRDRERERDWRTFRWPQALHLMAIGCLQPCLFGCLPTKK